MPMRSRVHAGKRPSTVIPLFGVGANGPKRRSLPTGFGQRDGFDRSPARFSLGLSPRRRHPKTGIPHALQRAAEQESGISMDDVRVSYNSRYPGTVGARAVARGNSIALAPGAESSLAHELGHIAQQKFGLVAATGERHGQAANDEASLERDADTFRNDVSASAPVVDTGNPQLFRSIPASGLAPMQCEGDSDSEDADDEQPAKKRRTGTKKKPTAKATAKVKDTKARGSKASIGDVTPKSSPKKRAAPVSAPKKPAAPRKPAAAKPKKETPAWEAANLAFKGAQQQGKISRTQGKRYEGPVSLKGDRASQIVRQYTNLTLNRATLAQKAKDVKLVDSAGRPLLDSKRKQKVKKAVRPVEVQSSLVGSRILINANNRESTQSIAKGIGAGSLFDYVSNAEARKPALDKDLERPKRYQSKLSKAKAKTRRWQQRGAVGENDADLAKASAVLTALQSPGVGTFDLSDEASINAELEKWKDDSAPKTYVVLHGDSSSTEHAERVQSRFRDKYLKPFESATSTKPVGPKTTCLGCTSYHRADYPAFADNSPYTGAYFSAGSPASTDEQIRIATHLATTRSAVGSNSQWGYTRNSDHPDSDTDDEGNLAYPFPETFTVPFADEAPTELRWKVDSGNSISVPSDWKRSQVLKQHTDHPGVSVAAAARTRRAPRKRKAASDASTSDTDSGAKTPVKREKKARAKAPSRKRKAAPDPSSSDSDSGAKTPVKKEKKARGKSPAKKRARK